MISFDKLDRALRRLEMIARYMEDSKYRKKYLIIRSVNKKREKLKQELLENASRSQVEVEVEQQQPAMSIEEKIKMYENAGLMNIKCISCGTPFEVDAKQLAFLARLYGGVDPDMFAVCPICRSNKKTISKMKRTLKKRSIF